MIFEFEQRIPNKYTKNFDLRMAYPYTFGAKL